VALENPWLSEREFARLRESEKLSVKPLDKDLLRESDKL